MLRVEDLRLGAEEEEGQGGDGRAVVYVNLAGSDLWFGKGKEGVREVGGMRGERAASARCATHTFSWYTSQPESTLL